MLSIIVLAALVVAVYAVATPLGLNVGIDVNTIPRDLTSTLDRYMERGRGTVALNETTDRTVGLAAKFFNRTKKTWDGGNNLREKLQFNKSEVAQWVAVGSKIDFAGTKEITWSSWPRRALRWAWFLDYLEIDTNKSEEECLNDIAAQALEDAMLSVIQMLRDAWDAEDGNYMHDGTGGNYLRMFGWRHLLTINGLHITNDSTKSIGGINPSSQALWRNPFVNPIEASDGRSPIKSIQQWRRAVTRIMTQLNFQTVAGYSVLGSKVKGVPEGDTPDDVDKLPDDFFGMCDTGTFLDAREVMFDRADNVGTDQGGFTLAPRFKGMPFMENEKMGIGSSGYGKSKVDGSALWTDPGGDYAIGQWAGYGETAILNTKYVHLQVHGDHAPKLYPAYKPERMAGVGNEGDWWGQQTCKSRRRCGGYIGPYQLLDS